MSSFLRPHGAQNKGKREKKQWIHSIIFFLKIKGISKQVTKSVRGSLDDYGWA